MGDRRNLASFIIMDQFGPYVAKVADWLMNRGRSNVKEIRMSTSLSSKLVKESLIVLIQHNIVQAIILENQSVCYELNIEAIIMRLRFSKFVAHAKTRFHEEGELIIEELLEHGRLSMGQVLDRVSPVIKDMRAAVSINISDEQARERLQNTFEQLITHHYLVLAEPPSSSTPSDSNVKPKANEIKMPGRPKAKAAAAPAPSSSSSSVSPSSSSSSSSSSSTSTTTTTTTTTTTATTERKKRGRKKADESAEPKKSAKKTKDKEEEAEEKPKKKPGRKRKEKEIDEDVQVMQDGPSATILASASAPLISDEPPAKKTKLVSTEFGMAVVDDNAQEDEKQLETDIMWRVNFSQFIVHFKIEAVIKYVTEKFSADAGEVIQVMFNLVEKGLDSKAAMSPVVMQPVLIQTLSQEAKTKNIPLNERDGYLDMMVKYNPAVLSRIGDAGYHINIQNVMNVVKQKVVESVVYDKFGPNSLRIFRLLMIKKQLEQQTVSDMAMIPLNESRSALYEMFTKGYLHLQEVSRQADHTPTKTFYLFNVNLPSVYSLLTQDMSKGVFNLLVRLSCEIERYKDVCYRADTFQEGTLSEADQTAYAKFKRIVEVMECSIARLDHSTMCLTDF